MDGCERGRIEREVTIGGGSKIASTVDLSRNLNEIESDQGGLG